MKQNFIQKLAFKLRPDLADVTGLAQIGQLLNVYMVLLNAPLLLVSMAWLIYETDLQVLASAWPFMLMILAITVLFSRFRFELQLELRPGVILTSGGTLRFIVTLSAVFIFGPTAYWIAVFGSLINGLISLRGVVDLETRWSEISQLFIAAATGPITILTGLWAYERLGGVYPLPNLAFSSVGPAIVLLIADWLLPFILLAPVLIYFLRSPDIAGEDGMGLQNMLFFIVFSSALPNLALPFTILGAALYALNGPGVYLFFLSGALLASILASRLTDSVRQRAQRARELAALEELGRLIIAAPPDASTLSDILTDQFSKMFYVGRGYIWLMPDEVLYESPNAAFPELEKVQDTVQRGAEPHYLFSPVSADDPNRAGLAVPIQNDDGETLGGVYFRVRQQNARVMDFLPALQALAAQIASALYRAETHREALQKERMTNELELAGRIQANFLPEEIPALPGYEIAASLTPALQTSGDFYDFIPLPEGRLGVLVADVADKGTGAALFMALSRTLIRTYAFEHPDEPELVLQYTNQRVHADTQSQLFVTTFYGVIDPVSHTLAYVNGGHNPPYVFSPENPDDVQALIRTGVPIGIFEDAQWKRKTIPVRPGELMVFYTDGVTEAQSADENFFDDDRLLELGKANLQKTAPETHGAILNAIHEFVGDAPQFDDLTLVVIRRG